MPRAVLSLVACLALATALRAQSAPLVALLDSYLQGNYDTAVRQAAAIDDLGPLRVRFVQDVPVWVNADAQVERRRAAAAAFLLELAHARLESDWGRLNDLI